MDPAILTDLGASGLEPSDLNAREVGPTELATTNSPQGARGYVIPYYDLVGAPIPFYRVRLFDQKYKYSQAKGSANQVYFPPQLLKVLKASIKADSQGTPYVILTEGEKKAAAGVKAGFPTIAIGGVDNWRSRTILLPKDTKFEQNYGRNKSIKAKLPTSQVQLPELSTLANGMQQLIDLLKNNKLTIIIIFDTDSDSLTGIKVEVQRAAAMLAYELCFKGIEATNIRQVILPKLGQKSKIGLDDFLMSQGPKALSDLIAEALAKRSAFPRHPNPRAYIGSRLEASHLKRKDAQSVSLSILAELDAQGQRLISKDTRQPFFFNESTHRLMPAGLLQRHGEPYHETSFGAHLYQQFGLSAADSKVITWLATQYLGEPTVIEASPKRVLAFTEGSKTNNIAVQMSDSQFIEVTSDPSNPIRACNNGSVGILFEQDQVESLDADEVVKEFNKQLAQPIKPWWLEVLSELNFQGGDSARDHAAILCYISPFISRWRGTQLPVEIVTGEAGSGKSSIYNLRLSILTGRPLLRNIPSDLKDWHASIVNTGGLHVIDNVHFTNKDLKQSLSDGMCRIVTEPNPYVEMRRLYTTSGQIRSSVNVTFAMTAIQQPFYNVDLIQRAAVFSLDALGTGKDGDWVTHQLAKFGGRLKWYAHQLVVLHKFLVAACDSKKWNDTYRATHRLAHYEQSLQIAADILGINSSGIVNTLKRSTEEVLSEADWALEGLKEFAKEYYLMFSDKVFSAKYVAEWSLNNEDYDENSQLTNARRLGRYIQTHKNMLKQQIGIIEQGSKANKRVYIIQPPKPDKIF